MSVFRGYAQYYDLLYRDKDYAGEARYVEALLAQHAPGARRLLELGCGTGAYTECFLRAGFSIDALDLSDEMVRLATARLGGLPGGLRSSARLLVADARNVELGTSYDAVVSLFHVLSYQQTNADVLAFLGSAVRHLEVGGVAVFDFWYGPAVLSDRPAVRVRRCAAEVLHLTRIAEPRMRLAENLVEVHYELLAEDRQAGLRETLSETHVMRYFFLPEINQFLEMSGFTNVAAYRWMTLQAPDEGSWNVCVVARRHR